MTEDDNSCLLCTEDDNSCYRNVCKMSVVSFALAVVFIIRLFSTSAFRVPYFSEDVMTRSSEPVEIPVIRAFLKIISGHKFEKPNSGHVW